MSVVTVFIADDDLDDLEMLSSALKDAANYLQISVA